MLPNPVPVLAGDILGTYTSGGVSNVFSSQNAGDVFAFSYSSPPAAGTTSNPGSNQAQSFRANVDAEYLAN